MLSVSETNYFIKKLYNQKWKHYRWKIQKNKKKLF